jgi:HTH-type transcriptional regulator, sugar sensing transcriptional regulator
MERDRFIEPLTQLGLTSYEAKAYIALTRRGSFSAAEVARLAGLPRQRIYDVLNSLVERGLAVGRPGRVDKYSATDPKVAIERLLGGHRKRLIELETSSAAMLDDLASAFTAGQKESDPLDYIEVLRDPGAINQRFGDLQAAVKSEILVFTKPPYATPPQQNVEGLTVVKSHVARSIYEFSLFEDRAATDGVRKFIAAGEEARFVPQLPLKLVIIDETIVMFGMEDPVAGGSDLTIMVVEHPSLAKVLRIAFNAYWAQGLTFDEALKQRTEARSATG